MDLEGHEVLVCQEGLPGLKDDPAALRKGSAPFSLAAAGTLARSPLTVNDQVTKWT